MGDHCICKPKQLHRPRMPLAATRSREQSLSCGALLTEIRMGMRSFCSRRDASPMCVWHGGWHEVVRGFNIAEVYSFTTVDLVLARASLVSRSNSPPRACLVFGIRGLFMAVSVKEQE